MAPTACGRPSCYSCMGCMPEATTARCPPVSERSCPPQNGSAHLQAVAQQGKGLISQHPERNAKCTHAHTHTHTHPCICLELAKPYNYPAYTAYDSAKPPSLYPVYIYTVLPLYPVFIYCIGRPYICCSSTACLN